MSEPPALGPCSSLLNACVSRLCANAAGGQVVQRSVRTLLFVIVSPALDLLSRVLERDRPVGTQAFVAQSSVETLHLGVLHGLAPLSEL